MNLFLKLINVLIAIVVVAGLGAAWWFGWRPLPQTTGAIEVPVASPVTVERDGRGIPTITAADEQDLYFAQGYVAAQDRLWHMESLRRAGSGTLSEVIGKATVAVDRETRALRLARIAERQVTTLTERDRAALAAYARGVNHYLRTQRGNYPVEFQLLGFDPRPWRMEDSLVIGLLLYRSLSTSWKTEIDKAMLMVKGDREKVELLYSPRGGKDVQPGSNAWALAGSRTASGKPLLANDPHLEHSLPGIWHAARLKTKDLDVFGVGVPGIPGIILGRNQRIAWGFTNVGFDVQDLYLEQIDMASGRYLYKGQMLQATLDHEWIPVKGAPAEEFRQWVTVHGPVLTTVGNRQAAMRWAAAEPVPFHLRHLDMDRARNWEEFRAALEEFPAASSNVVYADVEGNIGLQVMGRLPKRVGYRGDVPVEGSLGQNEWDGFIPFAELPSVYNPPSGRVLTANQNLFPPDYPYPVNGNFAAPYRAQQIADRIAAHPKWTPAETVMLQADVYDGFLHHLAAHVTAAAGRSQVSAGAAPAVALLKDWNGQAMPELAAPLIATYTYLQLRHMVGDRAANQTGSGYSAQMGSAILDTLLTQRPAGWFDDWDKTLLAALEAGLEEGRRAQGSDVTKWKFGAYQQITIRHAVLQQLPSIGKYFNIGPVGLNGSQTTVKQTSGRLLPSMRLVADFGDPQGGLFNLLAGESGHPFSGHFKDQWPAFRDGVSFPMFSPAAETLRLTPAP